MKSFSLCLILVAGAELDRAASDKPRLLREPQEPPNPPEPETKYTPLMIAAYAGNMALAQSYLASGALVDATDASGVTALMLAAFQSEETMVRFLLAVGAEVNARDSQGRTALMVAAHRGDVATARRLLTAGALVAAESRDGVTAAMLAEHSGHKGLTELLHAAGTQRLIEAADGVASGAGISVRHLVDSLHAAKTVGVETRLIGHAEKRLVAAVQGGQGVRLLEQLRDAINDAIAAGEVGEMNRLNEAIEATVSALQTHRTMDTPAARAALVEMNLRDSGRGVVALVLATAAWWPTAGWWQGFACAFPAVLAAWKFVA